MVTNVLSFVVTTGFVKSDVVFLNGVTLHSFGNYIDYQISDNTLTLTFTPDIGDILLISYVIDE